VCGQGDLVIGKHSVIGANSVVTRSIPANSVVSGNPGRIVKSYDPSKGKWVMGGGPARDAVKPESEKCLQGTGDTR
jgi:acetyltransferase-like isoleucine patch superfamily enzyme